MHDILLGFAFIAMVATPAMVATMSGKKEYDPHPQPESSQRTAAPKPQRTAEIIRPRSAQQRASRISPETDSFEVPTLPMYKSRGMTNR